jgi:hypothetical protein
MQLTPDPVRQARDQKRQEANLGLLLGLLFGPEDGGDIFLQNIGLIPNYTALQPTRPFLTVSDVRN